MTPFWAIASSRDVRNHGRVAHLLFVVGLCSRELRQRIGWQFTLSSIAILILAASIVPALSFWGENARYAIPVQSLVIVVVLIAGPLSRSPY